MQKKTIIISLGGSLVVPSDIDIGFLKNFRGVINKYAGAFKFFILVGGGKVARNYQKALLEFKARSSDRDWIGYSRRWLEARMVN